MTKHLLLPSAALSLFAGCLLEVTPEPPPPPPPPGVVLDLHGQLLDASGNPAPFVPVQLGPWGGPKVATDEDGAFVFPAVEEGEYKVYAFDRFAHHIAVATVDLVPGSEDVTFRLRDCREVLDEDSSDVEVVNICLDVGGIDLPPASPDVVIATLELPGGGGSTDPYDTSISIAVDADESREVLFSMHDGLGRGGVRELTVVNHRLEGAPPDSDGDNELTFRIITRDANGHQQYEVRDGVFRLEVAEGNTSTRAYVLTGTSLVLEYVYVNSPFDSAYTLTVDSLRLEGTLEVELPPSPPAGDINLELANAGGFAYYTAGRQTLGLSYGSYTIDEEIGLRIEPLPLPLPGTVTVELPIGDAPDLQTNVLSMGTDGDTPLSRWNFQLVSYTLSTEMTEPPGCNAPLQITLENLVFRFVGWDYDENSDFVESFGDQTLTIDRLDIDVPAFYEEPDACR